MAGKEEQHSPSCGVIDRKLMTEVQETICAFTQIEVSTNKGLFLLVCGWVAGSSCDEIANNIVTLQRIKILHQIGTA